MPDTTQTGLSRRVLRAVWIWRNKCAVEAATRLVTGTAVNIHTCRRAAFPVNDGLITIHLTGFMCYANWIFTFLDADVRMIAYNLVADTYGNEISLRRLMSVFTVENFFIKSPEMRRISHLYAVWMNIVRFWLICVSQKYVQILLFFKCIGKNNRFSIIGRPTQISAKNLHKDRKPVHQTWKMLPLYRGKCRFMHLMELALSSSQRGWFLIASYFVT